MIDVSLTPSNKKPETYFPCIKQHKLIFNVEKKVLIVLFTDACSGTVLYSNVDKHKMGDFNSTWIDARDTYNWEPFVGTITIKTD